MRESSCASLRFASNQTNLEKVSSMVDNLATTFRLAPDKCGDILISLTEAVNNAIIHGNNQDESKFVEVRAESRNGHIAISVSDQGKGFDPASVPDPTTPERICECGGRGVYLMRQLSDCCRFTNNGRTVEMEFKV